MWDFKKASATSGGSVTCTCREGTGCNPDQAGNCYMMSCTLCKKETSGVMMRSERSGEVGLIGSKEALEKNLPYTDEALFDVKIVQDALMDFEKKYEKYLVIENDYCSKSMSSGKCQAQKGHTFIAVNVYGSTTFVPAKKEILRAVSGSVVTVSSLSCSCNVSGSCPMDSTWGHKYCDASSCTSCTMHGVAKIHQSVAKIHQGYGKKSRIHVAAKQAAKQDDLF
eukprot:15366255-Ditylum_brightwellii.AAC.1